MNAAQGFDKAVFQDADRFFETWCKSNGIPYEPEVDDDPERSDAQALIDYVTTLSKIHGKRISIFTVPEREGKERFTRCEFGFGRNTLILQGHGDDIRDVSWRDDNGDGA